MFHFAMLILAPPSAESLFEGSSPLYVFIHSLHRSTQVTAIVRTGWSNPSKRDRPGGTSNNRRAATCKLGSWGAGVTDADLADQKKLGRIKCGWFDGRGSNFAEKKFDKIYTMSGRSFSIISTETWETVGDPGSLMEETLAKHYPAIFNSEAEVDELQVSF